MGCKIHAKTEDASKLMLGRRICLLVGLQMKIKIVKVCQPLAVDKMADFKD